MKTPVCVFLRESYENGNSMNSRVYSLLHVFHLESHILTQNAKIEDALKCIDEDYAEAHQVLGIERKKSLNFCRKHYSRNEENTMANSVVVTENDMSLCIGCMACLHVSEQLHSSRLLLSL